ncbi:MAG: DUF2252 domain-containing protein [Solirubrobacterales bacterium]
MTTINSPGLTGKHQSVEERQATGKAARAALSRSSHAEFVPGAARFDPLELLRSEDVSRVPELVPIRYGRMLTSPFAFYRGSAVLMANDLGAQRHSQLLTQLCGDAHLSNFGVFGAPDRRLVFDINDFDETLPGPWEWDVKRLAASIAIAGRSLGHAPKQRAEAVCACVATYRERMRELAEMTNLEVWYSRLEADQAAAILNKEGDAKAQRRLDKFAEKAYTRDSMREFKKLTRIVDGEPRIASDPPLIVPAEELAPGLERDQIHDFLDAILRDYASKLASDRRHLLEQYRLVHAARKVVGVGSVGTRVWIVLLLGRDDGDPLFLQVKEAGRSVLEPLLGPSELQFAGERVIAGQRLMQAAPDILLGWQNAAGIDGVEREFYVRQLKDWKGSAKIETFDARTLGLYGALCGRVLARAHARGGDRVAIASYLGKSETFDRAIAGYAEKYADQNEADYARVQQAAEDGEIEVINGL